MHATFKESIVSISFLVRYEADSCRKEYLHEVRAAASDAGRDPNTLEAEKQIQAYKLIIDNLKDIPAFIPLVVSQLQTSIPMLAQNESIEESQVRQWLEEACKLGAIACGPDAYFARYCEGLLQNM